MKLSLMKVMILLVFISFNASFVTAQVQDEDSTTVVEAIKKGKLSGNLRSFTMATDNQKGLTDGFANALALSIKFETAKFYRFQLAIGATSIANLYSTDLEKTDPKTGQSNRYELGLFDVTNPAKKYNLNRLEELYLKYNFKLGDIKLGRQLINTSFINFQDGRMRPTAVEGAFATINVGKNSNIKAGLLWKMGPRSTLDFYSPGQSIGIYPAGVNSDGTKSVYKDQIKSNAVAVLETQSMLSKSLSFTFSNVFTEHVFNTTLFQLDKTIAVNQYQFFLGLQAIKQLKLNDGGNRDQNLTYFSENHTGFTLGARIGVKNKSGGISLNYNRITAKSQYLFPREWGKDPFFTFMPRERNEGFGDVHAFNLKLDKSFLENKLNANITAGYFHLPDVKNYRLNKYGMPSYTQLNLDLKYNLKNIDIEFLYTKKWNEGQTYNNEKFIINKVNMTNYNFIINYRF